MEDQIKNAEQEEEYGKFQDEYKRKQRLGRIFGGILVIVAGKLLLLRELGVAIPDWVFTWQMLLIAIGIFSGAKHRFVPGGWIFLIVIGAAFMADSIIPGLSIGNLIWPAVLIIAGIFIVFGKKFYKQDRYRHEWHREKWERHEWDREKWERNWHDRRGDRTGFSFSEMDSSEDYISSTSVFSGSKKNIISKNFKGGEVTNVFGGSEINMMQADFQGQITLEVTQVFGGTKLVMPSNWYVKLGEVTTIMGAVEDHRPRAGEGMVNHEKILVLRGTTVFGGIEIVSY